MILLALGCSPFGTDFALEDVQPGTAGVVIPLRTVVWIPPGATDGPVSGTLRIDRASRTIEAVDRFGATGSYAVQRLVTVELDHDGPFAVPIWVGRWDDDGAHDDLDGTLFTVLDDGDGWLAEGLLPEPWIEMDPVLVHPDRSWFPTDSPSSTHGTAARR